MNDFPSTKAIGQWITDTIRHAYHIEYYLQRLQVGFTDIQRPHDIVGYGNKLEWPCIRGYAMQYEEVFDFNEHILPALEYHRKQDHHQSWNTYHPNVSTDAMRLGAVDAVCSLLEPRGYQGGCHSFHEIHDIAEANQIHKVAWMQLMAGEMEKIHSELPPVIDFKPFEVPTQGLTKESHDIILGRLQETIVMLKHDQGIEVTL